MQQTLDGVVSEIATEDSDVELTPPEVFEPVLAALGLAEFDFDPASHPQALVRARLRYCPPQDGLMLPWPDYGVGWLNPPYSNPLPWVQMAAAWTSLVPDRTMIALLKLDPTTRWWRSCVEPTSAIGVVLLSERVRHVKPGRAKNEVSPFASVLVAFGSKDDYAEDVLQALDGRLGKAVFW